MPTELEPSAAVAIGAREGVRGTETFFNNAVVAAALAVKTSAGGVHGFEVSNPTTDDVFLKFYDTAQGTVNVAADTPLRSILIPAGTASGRGGADEHWIAPMRFGTAISIAVAQESGPGATAPTSGVTVNVDFI